MNQKPSHIFIGGHRKCGTTLLLSLLDNHPELITYPMDVHILYAFHPTYTEGNFKDEERLQRLDRVIFGNMRKIWSERGWSGRLNIQAMRDTFFKKIQKINLSNISEVLQAQVESFRIVAQVDQEEPKPIVIKETSIEIYANYLIETFPNSKFIHLVRDPRDNYAALKSGIESRYKSFNDDANTILMSMINRCGLGMQMAHINKRRFKDKYLIIRHEDVVTDTKFQMNLISNFIGVQFEETMLHPSVMGLHTSGNNFNKIDMSEVKTVNINRWRERITKQEAQVIEFYFKETMNEFEYATYFSEQDQADAATEFYKWSNYNYFYYDHFNDLQEI